MLTTFSANRVLKISAIGFSLASTYIPNAWSETDSYSAPIREQAKQVYWGDTHLHSTESPDAFNMYTRLSRKDAYRFARGETVIADNGMPARLRRPLDFLAVTDHSEYLGLFPRLKKGGEWLEQWSFGQQLQDLLNQEKYTALVLEFSHAIQSDDEALKVPLELQTTVWDEVCQDAETFYQPGLFTTLIGYEWTSMITGDNLHRVVLHRDGGDKACQVLPYTAQDSTDPEKLWDALEHYEKTTHGEVLAIAHNGNVSNGRMFSPLRNNGQPITKSYAEKRMRWEPVYEMTQVKGDSETHPYLSPEDPFADYETWDEGNITLTAPKKPDMLQYEYARSALKLGLKHENQLGTNPFKFGMIGSTDSHTGMSTAAEDNFFGKFAHDEPSADRVKLKMAGQLQEVWKLVSSGLAAVWAEQNTREAIFDAFKRREVYASTGPRIKLRFFAGWDFTDDDLYRPDFASIGYQRGVPMGGELTAYTQQTSPNFMIMASKDPDGANLDRIQVVKGWLDDDGQTHEKVYDVALSDDRTVNTSTGVAPKVGSTVNLDNATYTNTIGDVQLATVWQDPDFNSQHSSFYYVRVLEIPTPRWTVYDAVRLGADVPDEAMTETQERVYSSPIWYTPK